MKLNITIIVLLLFPGFSVAQKEYNQWYFWEGAGLDFNESPPKILNDGALKSELNRGVYGISTICDYDGNLMLYTDGFKIYNKYHQLMEGGILLQYPEQQASSPLIIPRPNLPDNYYLFYSRVVTSIDSGYIGQLYTAEISYREGLFEFVYKDSLLFEIDESFGITGIKINCDTTLISIGKGYYYNNQESSYLFSVTKDGINSDPEIVPVIISNLSNNLSKIFGLNEKQQGIKVRDFDIRSFTQSNEIELFKEDSLLMSFPSPQVSPNGNYLYVLEYAVIETDSSGEGFSYNILRSYLYQYDLSLDTEENVQKSKLLIAGPFEGEFLSDMEIAPDGKIYVSGLNYYWMGNPTIDFHVIHSPNKPGIQSNFQINYLRLSGDIGSLVQNYLLNTIAPDFSFSSNSVCTGIPIQFSGSNVENDPANYSWDFGDPSSGPDNFSNDQNPTHLFTKPGEYLVRMEPGCIQKKLYITSPPQVNLGTDTIMCLNEPVLLTVGYLNPYTEYEWSHPTALSDSNYAYNSGLYWVKAINGCDIAIDSILVTKVEAIDVLIAANGICVDDEVQFSSTVSDVPDTYIWNFSDQGSGKDSISSEANPDHLFSAPGEYHVTLKLKELICDVGEADTTLIIEDRPAPDLGLDQIVCFDKEIKLNGGNYLSPMVYTWSNGSREAETIPDKTGWYKILVENNCDSVEDSVFIDIIPEIISLIPDDTVVCDGNFALLDAGNVHPMITYEWNDGSTDQILNTQAPGKYWVTIGSECNVVVDSVNLYFIREEFGLEAPNVITPNGDGYNDEFILYALHNPDYSLTILNRNGKVIFYTEDRFEGWDGTYNGTYVANGIYFWAVNGVDCEGAPKTYKGWLSVMGAAGSPESG